MKRKMKKLLSFMLTLVMVAGMLPALGVNANTDPERANTVDEKIRKIQSQVFTDTTWADCEDAKAAWDALRDEEKALVENYDYFGLDTGDASADDPRNQDEIGENEILVVSFGTSYNDRRIASIGSIENAVAEVFPEWSVRRAFTSQIVINHIYARDGVKIDNVNQALARAEANGVKKLIVAPTHLLHGAEYDELVEQLEPYRSKMEILIAEPLLGAAGETAYEINEDQFRVAENVVADVCDGAGYRDAAAAAAAGAAIVLVGQGTPHCASVTYEQMQAALDQKGYNNVFVGTIDGEPVNTDCQSVINAVKEAGFSKVILRPLMVVAGSKVHKDMADADEQESWYRQFADDGSFSKEDISCQLTGLGEIESIRQIYVDHINALLRDPVSHDVWWKYGNETLYISDTKAEGYAEFTAAQQQAVDYWNYMPPWGDHGNTCKNVVIEGASAPASTKYWFHGFSSLAGFTDLDKLNTAAVTDMMEMFSGCRSLTELDVSGFDTSSVTDMSGMFYNCSELKTIYAAPGTDWYNNTRSMNNMFLFCYSLVGGNGSKCDGMKRVNGNRAQIDGLNKKPGYFTIKHDVWWKYDENKDILYISHENKGEGYAKFTAEQQQATGWKDAPWYAYRDDCTGVVIEGAPAPVSTAYWFDEFGSLTGFTDLEKLDTTAVTNMQNMFSGCKSLTELDVSGFVTKNVTAMGKMLNSCSGLTELDLTGFDTSKVTTMENMFNGCSGLTELDLTGFDTGKVTAMRYMFSGCKSLTELDLTGFDTSKVTNMMHMFYGCRGLTELDVSGFDTSSVTDMSFMFYDCSKLNTIYAAPGTNWYNSARYMVEMFNNCIGLVGGRNTAYNGSHMNDGDYARIDGGTEDPGYFTANYDLWVGGVLVTDKNLSGEGWSFDPSTSTLTLNNANITGAVFEEKGNDNAYGIYSKNELTLNLVGDNSITCPSKEGLYGNIGISANGKYLNITGDGSLKVTAGAASLLSFGIYANTLTMENGTVVAEAENTGVCLLTNFEMKGGSLTAVGKSKTSSVGIMTRYATISGGTVESTGTTRALQYAATIKDETGMDVPYKPAIGKGIAVQVKTAGAENLEDWNNTTPLSDDSFKYMKIAPNSITFEFVSGTEGMQLPDDVTKLLPDKNKIDGIADGRIRLSELLGDEGDDKIPSSFNAVPVKDAPDGTNIGIWRFQGWQPVSPAEIQMLDNVQILFMNSSNVTMRGKWVYTPVHSVTFEFVSATEGAEIPPEVTAKLPEPNPVGIEKQVYINPGDFVTDTNDVVITTGNNRGRWTFKEWVYTGHDTDVFDDITYIRIVGDTTVKGEWTFTAAPKYGVEYIVGTGEAGTDYPAGQTAPTDPNTYYSFDPVTLVPGMADVSTDTGIWKFKGWDARNLPDGKMPGFADSPTGKVQVFGTWEFVETFTVTFHANGHGTAPSGQTVEKGKTAFRPADPTARGWKFGGWYTEEACTNAFDFTTPVEGNINLYAQWTEDESGGGVVTPARYTLTYDTGGGSEVKATKHDKGTTVSLTATPVRDGYTFTGWYSDAELTKKITSVQMDGDKTVYAGWKQDDPIRPTPSPYLNYSDHNAYIKGYPDGTFGPNKNITRAESAVMIYRLLTDARKREIHAETNDFSDVDSKKWYNTEVSSMAKGGYVTGYPNGTFGGEKTITRAEFVTILVRFFDPAPASGSFSDVNTKHWAYGSIMTASAYGWVNGYEDGTFRPDRPITRAEAVAIINRILGRGIGADSTLGDFRNFTDNTDDGKWYYYEIIEASNTHEYTGERPDENWTKIIN